MQCIWESDPKEQEWGLGRGKEARRESQHGGAFSASHSCGHRQLSPLGRRASEMPTCQTQGGGLNPPVPTPHSSKVVHSMVRLSQVQESSVSSVPHAGLGRCQPESEQFPMQLKREVTGYTCMKLVATAMVRVEAGPKGSRASTQVCKE